MPKGSLGYTVINKFYRILCHRNLLLLFSFSTRKLSWFLPAIALKHSELPLPIILFGMHNAFTLLYMLDNLSWNSCNHYVGSGELFAQPNKIPEVDCDGLASHPARLAILLFASCSSNKSYLWTLQIHVISTYHFSNLQVLSHWQEYGNQPPSPVVPQKSRTQHGHES